MARYRAQIVFFSAALGLVLGAALSSCRPGEIGAAPPTFESGDNQPGTDSEPTDILAADCDTCAEGVFTHNSSSYSFDEGSVSASFTVQRLEGSAGTATVRASSLDGTATAARGDYLPVDRLLEFAPGVTEVVTPLGLAADVVSDRAFFIQLSEPSPGTRLGEIVSSRIEIVDTTPCVASSGTMTVPSVAESFVAMVGQDVVLFKDVFSAIAIEDEPNISARYSADVGVTANDSFLFTPQAGDVGFHPLMLEIMNGTDSLDCARTGIVVYPPAGGGATKILMVGDSLVIGGTQTLVQIEETLPQLTISWLGTMGTAPYLSEGHSGKTYAWLATDPTSPFVYNGVVDIGHYLTASAIPTPDFVHIRCGVNEAFGQRVDNFSASELDALLAHAKSLVDGFLEYHAATRVVIGLPTISENTGAAWADNYGGDIHQNGYIVSIMQLRRALHDLFGEKRYDARVYVSYEGMMLDRDDGYPKSDGVHTNAVHPSTAGYRQLGRSIAYTFNAILAGK